MDVRRLHSMVRHLPEDSALSREMTRGWTPELELAALTAEIGHESYRAFLAAHGVKRGRLPAPLHIPRPGDAPKPKRRRARSVAEVVAAITAGHTPRRGGEPWPRSAPPTSRSDRT